MYWYPYDFYRFGDARQMMMPAMPSPEMERMQRMMEQHMAVTNEILRLVRDNHRMLRAVHARLVTPPYPYPARGEEADSVTGTEADVQGQS